MAFAKISRQYSCCHSSSHPTIVAPARFGAAVFLAARAEETADDEGDVLPNPHLSSSRHAVPPCAVSVPPEVATPHAPLSPSRGEALLTVRMTALTRASEQWRRAAARWDTRLAAVVERLPAMLDGAAFPRSSAPDHDAETLGAY
jgi:hypothetical protein